MKQENDSLTKESAENIKADLKKLDMDVPLELIECIQKLQEEIDEGKVSERIIEFAKNLENLKTNGGLSQKELESISGGSNTRKEYLLWLLL